MKEKKSLKHTFPTVYTYFKKKWDHIDEEAFHLLTRKGVYPYEYFDSHQRFNEAKLPENEKYYSTLKNEGITDEEYDFAKEVWSRFKLKNLGELHDLYMNTDVMLLADVFESFRKTSLEKYKLDPAHFTSAPGLSWAACLRKTGVRLTLVTDPDMSIFIDMSLLGGGSGVFEPWMNVYIDINTLFRMEAKTTLQSICRK